MAKWLRSIILNYVSNLQTTLNDTHHHLWEERTKKKFEHCGVGVHLNGFSSFVAPENIHIKDNVHIGDNCWLQGMGGIEIGEHTHISRNCAIFSASHEYNGQRLPYDETFIKKQVIVGRNTWIGMNVMIIPGVVIGEGCIIGLGTVVTKDVPPLAIIGSHGHRIIGYRNEEHYQELDRQGLYGGRAGRPLRY